MTLGKERIPLQGGQILTPWFALEICTDGVWACCALVEQLEDAEMLLDDADREWRIVEVWGEATVSRGDVVGASPTEKKEAT